MKDTAIIWLRRSMRLEDQAVIAKALADKKKLLFIFIFDTDILQRFSNKHDRRLTFLAQTIIVINKQLQALGAELLVFSGPARQIVQHVVHSLEISSIYADEDFEPNNITRDNDIKQAIRDVAEFELVLDHLLMQPSSIGKDDGSPYRVFSPFMKKFRQKMDELSYLEHKYDLTKNLITSAELSQALRKKLKLLDITNTSTILTQIGYKEATDMLWNPAPKAVDETLDKFLNNVIDTYKESRNFPDRDGTSQLSPYIRFGRLSIRKCYRLAHQHEHNFTWINELIWREFYAYIMFHFPESVNQEFQKMYRGKIPWQKNDELFAKYTAGLTGFPIVDAGMRQLKKIGWMHNRLRMITASFLTKNLHMDWRLGEEHFAQYLMDYDLASNEGGWQWSASTGADPQPYFRIFNPWLQAVKFDPQAEYIKTYIPELANVPAELIHDLKALHKSGLAPDYPQPIIDYVESRDTIISLFKAIKDGDLSQI